MSKCNASRWLFLYICHNLTLTIRVAPPQAIPR